MAKPYATVIGPRTSLANKTGSWRTLRPEYVAKLPPCNVTCPAGENIQSWLSLAQEGKFRKAWETMVQDNPFPAIMGRVCYHTCEKACNRGHFDGSVNINLIERSIGDVALESRWEFDEVKSSTGKKILIVGAGPSGLSAAYFLRKLGHDVTIYETHPKPGGMMRYGVPRYRLPREVLDAEINRIINLGVKLVCDKHVDKIKDVIGDFDATYIAAGAHLAEKRGIEVKNNAKVIDAVELFRRIEDNPEKVEKLGDTVVVYGGGNTAIDAARTSLRLGAKNVKIVYRRTINCMPAHDIEIKEALAEGVEILCLCSIGAIDGNKIYLNKMSYDEENDILNLSGEQEVIESDYTIFAIGQSIDAGILEGIDEIVVSEKGVIEVDKNMMTGAKGVFAGGDVIHGQRTVTHAIGYGKRVAKCIDAYLSGVEIVPNKKHEVTTFKTLNTAYFKKNPRGEIQKPIDISFEEPDISLGEREIIAESDRCFSCGNCFHCDNCYGYCPDNAIIKHDDGTLEINYDYCKGCGICASECPCSAIKMVSDK